MLPAALFALFEDGKQGLTTPPAPARPAHGADAGGLGIVHVFGRIFLGEGVIRQRWVAVCIGFVGVMIVLQPSRAGLGRPVVLALAAALVWAFATTASRKLGQNERSSTVLFTYMLFSLVSTDPFVVGQWTPIATDHMVTFILISVVGTVAHWFLTQAFRYSDVSLLAPFEYTRLVWAIDLGFWFWGDGSTRVMFDRSLAHYWQRSIYDTARKPDDEKTGW